MPDLPQSKTHHTAQDRAQLFDDMFARMMRRDALVPVKNERLGLDVAAALQVFRSDFIAADTDQKLIYAILRMSNARRDVHVKVWLVRDGLTLPGVSITDHDMIRIDRLPVEQVPIHFTVDFGDPDAFFFFVADTGTESGDFVGRRPEIGDRLVGVNGLDISEWCVRHQSYLRWSTKARLWWTLAKALSIRSHEVAPELYSQNAEFTLEDCQGHRYDIALDWRSRAIHWSGTFRQPGQDRYPGFTRVLTRTCYNLYISDTAPIVLLDWKHFNPQHAIADTDALLEWGREAGVLGHGVIFDGTRSRGGSYGAYVLQALTASRFTATFGNLRISDIVAPFTDLIGRGREEGVSLEEVDAGVWMDDGTWLWDWLTTDVREALARGDAYSNNVPFKLTHLPKTSDGRLDPHPDHFQGPMAAMFGPYGGSHLDQFAAMVTDNGLAHTIGMPTGGYSNTWEWVERIDFPFSRRPAVGLMYSMGHTIRPNSELLDGNPPAVAEYIPQTRENFARYPEILLQRALDHLTAVGYLSASRNGAKHDAS